MSKRKGIKAEEKICIAKECIAGRISQSEAEAQADVARIVVMHTLGSIVIEDSSISTESSAIS